MRYNTRYKNADEAILNIVAHRYDGVGWRGSTDQHSQSLRDFYRLGWQTLMGVPRYNTEAASAWGMCESFVEMFPEQFADIDALSTEELEALFKISEASENPTHHLIAVSLSLRKAGGA